MSRFLKGGYIILDSTDANFYKYAYKAVNSNKPVMLYNASGIPYYIKNIKLIGTTVVITTDDEIIAVASDGTVTTSKNITNIQAIPSAILAAIECGDNLIKVTDGKKYSYHVSYKKENTGICLTYVDNSVVETIKYDYTDGEWVYNSTDKSTDIAQVAIVEVSNITTITTAQLNALKVGDIVVKKTSEDDFVYVVNYKKDNFIYLTYVDYKAVETVSYDYTNGSWVYRVTVSTPLTE